MATKDYNHSPIYKTYEDLCGIIDIEHHEDEFLEGYLSEKYSIELNTNQSSISDSDI
ncbi:MAG: hypothetical protein J6M30_06380 [Bacteroidales bacterium]|nr:hypothetical protein [Bacteroidales bacterium]